jgi:hypothetical protein
MPKPRMKLDVVIPDYPKAKSSSKKNVGRPGLGWRRDIHRAIVETADARDIEYLRASKLDISVLLFMTDGQVGHGHDLDNMTKHLWMHSKASSVEKRERRRGRRDPRLIVRAYREREQRGLR